MVYTLGKKLVKNQLAHVLVMVAVVKKWSKGDTKGRDKGGGQG